MVGIIGEINGVNAAGMLGSFAADFNTTSRQNFITVPTGKTLLITRIVTRGVSASLSLAVFGFGFDSLATDVVAAAAHAALTGSTLMAVDVPIVGAKVGAATDVFGMKCTVPQGTAATGTVDIFGYLI